MHSTPAPSYHGNIAGFNTPGRRLPHIMMSTPGNSYSSHSDDMDTGDAKTPASSGKRRLTPDTNPGNPLFKNSQFSSPFISPIPKSLSYIKVNTNKRCLLYGVQLKFSAHRSCNIMQHVYCVISDF